MTDRVSTAATMLALCLSLAACGNASVGVGALAAAGKGDVCANADVTARVAAAYRPDTAALKARVRDGGFTIQADDVDGLAAGIAYAVSDPRTATARPGAIECTAQLAVSSSQYGVTDQPPATIRYRVVPAPGAPGYRIVPIDRAGKATAQAVFQQIVARLDGALANTDENATASTLGAITAAPVADGPLDQPAEKDSDAVPTR